MGRLMFDSSHTTPKHRCLFSFLAALIAHLFCFLFQLPVLTSRKPHIDDENYRRKILTQLNRGEGRHAVARVIFHGQRGELRQRYREGQEDQLGALGLVLNAVILWNTTYMQDALDALRAAGKEVLAPDVARLSPLI